MNDYIHLGITAFQRSTQHQYTHLWLVFKPESLLFIV